MVILSRILTGYEGPFACGKAKNSPARRRRLTLTLALDQTIHPLLTPPSSFEDVDALCARLFTTQHTTPRSSPLRQPCVRPTACTYYLCDRLFELAPKRVRFSLFHLALRDQ